MKKLIKSIKCLQYFFYNFTQEDIEFLKSFNSGHFYYKLIEKQRKYDDGQVICAGAWWDMLHDISDGQPVKEAIINRAIERYMPQVDKMA